MKLFKNQIFRLCSRQEGFNDTITMTIIGGIVGALFITGVFVWKEINKQNTLNNLYNQLSRVVRVEKEENNKNESKDNRVSIEINGVPNLQSSINFVVDNYDDSNFLIESSNTNDLEYNEERWMLDLLEYNYGDSKSTEELQKYVDSYESYLNSDFGEYRVSLFLVDEFGKEENKRWYFTENTLSMRDDELKYWNYCENAGCQIWPEKVLGDYIIWGYRVYPVSAGGNCMSVSGKPAYENTGLQARCEIIRRNDFLKSLDIELVKFLDEGVIDYTNEEVLGTDLMKFDSEELGLYFEYPESWGSLSVRYVDDTMALEEASPLVDSGKGVHIRFSDRNVNILLASDDFSQFLMEPYNGDENLAEGCSNLKYDSDKKYCETLVIAEQDTYGYFRRFNYECSGDDVRYSTFLNLPTNNYTGLKIDMFIGELQLPIDETEEREDICGRNKDNIEANLQAIYTRDGLNDDLAKKLQDFDIFLDSFKLN